MPDNYNALRANYDSSIPLQAKGITLPDPVQQYGNALSLLRGQQEVQTNALGLDQAQRTADENNSIRSRIAQPDFATLPPEQQIAALQQAGPIASAGLVKGILDNRKTLVDTNSTQQKMSIEARNGLLQTLSAAHTPQELMQMGVDGIKQGAWKLEQFAPVMLHLADGTINADNFRAHKQTMITALLNAKDQFDATQPTVQMVDSNGQQVPVNTKASAGPIGPIVGATSMPGTATTAMTDRGLLSIAPDKSSASYVQPGAGQGGAPAWLGPEPAGNFVGDPNAIRQGLNRITDPNDRAGAIRALANQINARGAGGAPANGIGAKDYTSPESAKNFGEYEKNLVGRVETYQTMLPMMDQFEKAFSNYQTGPSADTRLALAKIVASIPGINEKSPLVEFVNRGPIASSQEIQKLQGTMALEAIKSMLGPGNKMGQGEFKILEPKFPGIDTDPDAIRTIFGLTRQQAQRTLAEQQALDQAKATPGYDLTRFPAHWAQHLTEIGALNTQPRAPAGPVAPQTLDAIMNKYR